MFALVYTGAIFYSKEVKSMLDIKLLREQPKKYIDLLSRRGGDYTYLYDVIKMDKQRRELITEIESVKARRNDLSKLIGQYKREKKDATPLFGEIKGLGSGVGNLEKQLKELEETIKTVNRHEGNKKRLQKTKYVPSALYLLLKEKGSKLLKSFGCRAWQTLQCSPQK